MFTKDLLVLTVSFKKVTSVPISKVQCCYFKNQDSLLKAQNRFCQLQVFLMFSSEELSCWETVPPFVLHSSLLREHSFCTKIS